MSKTTVVDEAREEDGDIALRRDAEDVPEVLHLGHSPGDGQEQRGDRGEW
jgi:hypothetical protein